MKAERLTKENVLAFLRKHKPFFKKKFDVDNIILFGSFARDEATPTSDIDILIEATKKSFRSYADLTIFLEDNLKRKVDVIYKDSVNPFILEYIEQEMIYA